MSDRLESPLTAPSQLLPALAQNLHAARRLAESEASGARQAADALKLVDAADLGMTSGTIDVDAVASIEAPLLLVQSAVDDLALVLDEVESPWLLAPIDERLTEISADIDAVTPQLQQTIDAVGIAPALLGAEGERTYLMLFGSPSEARGLGGFLGHYAEIRLDQGRVQVTDFARRSRLQANADRTNATCAECPEEVLDGYGQYIARDDGTLVTGAWQNITMPADFPSVARTAQVLYPQSGGREIDGVIVLDPYVVATLMKYTGPVDVPDLGVTVRPRAAAQFLLADQYVLAGDRGNDERKDALQVLGEEVIQRILAGSLPEPAELGRDLAPLIDERRLLFWTDRPAEQPVLSTAGLLGDLPDMTDDGGFSVSVNNGSGNKIEIFLDREVDVAIVEGESGERRLVADVELTNGAPSTGYPRYIIGNGLGLPDGTSRELVTFYGPPGLAVAELDGEDFGYGVFSEAGWQAYRHTLTLGPGETASYHLEWPLEPSVRPVGEADPVGWLQPLVTRESP